MIAMYRAWARASGPGLLLVLCAWMCVDSFLGPAPDRYYAAAGWAVAFITLSAARSAVRRAEVCQQLLAAERTGHEYSVRTLAEAVTVPDGWRVVPLLAVPHEDHTDMLAARLPENAPWHTSS